MVERTLNKFSKLSEQYFDMFGDSFPTYSVDNDIEKACSEMEKAILNKQPFKPTYPKDMIL